MNRAVKIFSVILFLMTGILYAQNTLLVHTNTHRVIYPTNFWPAVSNDVNSVIASGAGLGTVTSVGATSVVAGLSFLNSPITSSGTLILTGAVASGSVTSVAASTTISGLGWTGSPITSAGTLGLTGVVGEASIDAAIARLASPVFTGDPTGPTPAANDNDTSLATTAYVQAEETALKAAQLWQGTNSVLTTVASLTGGTDTNFLAGDGAFKQVTTNMVPGLNDALAAAAALPLGTNTHNSLVGLQGGTSGEYYHLTSAEQTRLADYVTAKQRVAFWEASQFSPVTNSAASAIPSVRGNGFPNWTFSGTVDQSIVVHGIVPATGVVDLTGGVVVRVVASGTSTSAAHVLAVSLMRWTTDLDSDSYDTAVNMTNTVSGTSGIPTTFTATVTTIDSLANGEPFSLLVSRLPASNASDSDTGTIQIYGIEITED